MLSGSRARIGGPTGALIVIVYSVLQKYGYDGLAVATIRSTLKTMEKKPVMKHRVLRMQWGWTTW